MKRALVIMGTLVIICIYAIVVIVAFILGVVFEIINGLCMCASVAMAHIALNYFIIDRGYNDDAKFIVNIASKELDKLNEDRNSFKWIFMISMAKLLYNNTCAEYIKLMYMS